MFKNCLVAAAKSFVASDKIESAPAEYLQPQIPFAKKVRYLQLLQILLAHPRLTKILLAYFDSAAKGTTAAKQLIRESSDAVIEFRSSLANSPRSIWRYPALIVGGIQELGLGELAGFQEYALGIGAVIASKSPETLLNYIGMGLFAVAFMSGVGTGAAILDLAIGGASAYFSFVRERQQEQAMKASLFLPDKSKLATEFGYVDTSLALAFMLLAAISLFRTATAARARVPAKSATPQEGAMHSQGQASPTNKASDIPRGATQATKSDVITDAARAKESPANTRPASGKPAQANTVGQAQEADVRATGPNPPVSGKAPKAPVGSGAPKTAKAAPPQATPNDFPDLKLALNEAPAIANPTAEQVADAVKAFKKQLKRLNAEGLKAARFKDFYLTPRQGQTFSRLTDAILNSEGRVIPEGLTANRTVLLNESELNAANLRRRLKDHWDAALPRRGKQTAEQAALEILTKLTNEPAKTGTLNSSISRQVL